MSAGTPRNALQFATFLPGVNTGTSVQAFNARINGGLKMGDEAVMDGVSMQEGTMSQSGIVSFFDFAQTPDMVQEVRLMTSSYEPEYGTTTGGVMIVTTKSGTDQIHASAFEYLRNRDFNALQFTNNRGPGDQRPKDNENEYGFSGGLPIKIEIPAFRVGTEAQDILLQRHGVLALSGRRQPRPAFDSVHARPHGQLLRLEHADLRSEDPNDLRTASSSVHPYPGNQIPTAESEPAGAAVDEISADAHQFGSDQQFPGPARLRWHSVEPQRIPVPDRPLLGREGSLLLHHLAADDPTDRAVPVAGAVVQLRVPRIRRTPG